MNKFKKQLSGVLTATALLLCSALSPFVSASAATTSVLLGDANGDGYVNLADYTCMLQYLGGRYSASQYCFTAMDINEDCVVDKTDMSILVYREVNHITSTTTVRKELYTLPNNEIRTYKKYDCASKTISTYTLDKVPDASVAFEQSNQIDLQQIAPDRLDNENTNVVQLSADGGLIASGFVISKNVIATAAHCVYDVDNNSFNTGITVKIYDAQGKTRQATFEAKSYHIPELYINPGSNVAERDNYDYALIYVDDIVVDGKSKNLLSYAKAFDIGIAAQEFMNTGKDVTGSGFTNYSSHGYARYYSTGKVVDFSSDESETHNEPNLRIQTNAVFIPGKSGGVMYYTSTYDTTMHKSAVAVSTGGTNTKGTWGVRMNPTLIKFYFRNSNI